MSQAVAELRADLRDRDRRFPVLVGPDLGSAAAHLRSRVRDLSRLLGRPMPDAHWLRLWIEAHLLELTIVSCAGLAVVRRTDTYAQLHGGWARGSGAVRKAWGRAEGFEV